MADLDFKDVLLVSVVISVALTLLFFWYSAVMQRRNWSYQVRHKRKGPGPRPDNPVPSEVHGGEAMEEAVQGSAGAAKGRPAKRGRAPK